MNFSKNDLGISNNKTAVEEPKEINNKNKMEIEPENNQITQDKINSKNEGQNNENNNITLSEDNIENNNQKNNNKINNNQNQNNNNQININKNLELFDKYKLIKFDIVKNVLYIICLNCQNNIFLKNRDIFLLNNQNFKCNNNACNKYNYLSICPRCKILQQFLKYNFEGDIIRCSYCSLLYYQFLCPYLKCSEMNYSPLKNYSNIYTENGVIYTHNKKLVYQKISILIAKKNLID